jgi:hypothetical protein
VDDTSLDLSQFDDQGRTVPSQPAPVINIVSASPPREEQAEEAEEEGQEARAEEEIETQGQ